MLHALTGEAVGAASPCGLVFELPCRMSSRLVCGGHRRSPSPAVRGVAAGGWISSAGLPSSHAR
eukprot:1820143-Pyramimonas_sp.AAC.1